MTAGNGLSIGAEGPDTLSGALPTIIGVGVTRGRVCAGLIAGMELVTTTSTGVGVGSAGDCENVERNDAERNKATQKNFVYIVG